MVSKHMVRLVGSVLVVLLVTTGIAALGIRLFSPPSLADPDDTGGLSPTAGLPSPGLSPGEAGEDGWTDEGTGDPETDVTTQATAKPTGAATPAPTGSSDTDVITSASKPHDTPTGSATPAPTGSSDEDVVTSATRPGSGSGDETEYDPDSSYLTPDEAADIARDLVDGDMTILSMELEDDDNPPKYDITFLSGDFLYEIEIHAVTGAVIEFEKEYQEDDVEDDGEEDEADGEEDDD